MLNYKCIDCGTIFKENEEHCPSCGCPKIYAKKFFDTTNEPVIKIVSKIIFDYQCSDCKKIYKQDNTFCPYCGCPSNYAKKINERYLTNDLNKNSVVANKCAEEAADKNKLPNYSNYYIKCLVERQITYEKGYKYFLQNRVNIISQDIQAGIYKSEVKGSGYNIYDCELYFDKNNLKKHMCTCPAHTNYIGPCKHIVATMLAIKQLYSNNSIESGAEKIRLDSSDRYKMLEQNNCKNKSDNLGNDFSQNLITNEVSQNKSDIKDIPHVFWWNYDKFIQKEKDTIKKDSKSTKFCCTILEDDKSEEKLITLSSIKQELGSVIANKFLRSVSAKDSSNKYLDIKCKDDNTANSKGEKCFLTEKVAEYLIRIFRRDNIARCIGYIEYSKFDSYSLKQDFLIEMGFNGDIINAAQFLISHGAKLEETAKYKGAVTRSLNRFLERKKQKVVTPAVDIPKAEDLSNKRNPSQNNYKYEYDREIVSLALIELIVTILQIVSYVGATIFLKSESTNMNKSINIVGLILFGVFTLFSITGVLSNLNNDSRLWWFALSGGLFIVTIIGIILAICSIVGMGILWTLLSMIFVLVNHIVGGCLVDETDNPLVMTPQVILVIVGIILIFI